MATKKDAKLSKMVRQLPCRIVAIEADGEPIDAEARQHWRELSLAVQKATNDFMMRWLAWHLERGHDQVVRGWMDDYLAAAGGRGKKPTLDVSPCPKELVEALSDWILNHHPLNSRVRTLLVNVLVNKAFKQAGSKSNFKRWQLILAGRGEFPQSSGPLPIPFDRQNGGIIAPDDPDKDGAVWKVWFRLDRQPREGQTARSVRYVVTIATSSRNWKKNHRMNGFRTLLRRIASGEYEFAGSQLAHSEAKPFFFRTKRGGKRPRDAGWYIHLCYRMPIPRAEADWSRFAMVRASRRRPIGVRVAGRTEFLRRRTRGVAISIRRLYLQRCARQRAYHDQASARKGKGRKKATGDWTHKIGNRVDNLKKTLNRQLASDIAGRCKQLGIGTVVYMQPDATMKERAALEAAGRYSGGGGGWDWHGLGAALDSACKKEGLRYIKCSVGPSGKENARKLRPSLPLRPKRKGVRKDQVKRPRK